MRVNVRQLDNVAMLFIYHCSHIAMHYFSISYLSTTLGLISKGLKRKVAINRDYSMVD